MRRLRERKRDELMAGRLTAAEHPFDALSTKNPSVCKCGFSITDPAHQPALRFQPQSEHGQERRQQHG
jgi:hypothetical protein